MHVINQRDATNQGQGYLSTKVQISHKHKFFVVTEAPAVSKEPAKGSLI